MNPVSIGTVPIGTEAPLAIIAGPCAAESEQLCLEVAGKMQAACHAAGVGYVFKASFDKANRTAGTAGRGPGMEEGLRILAAVRKQCQVPVITDIHLPDQAAVVAPCVDALQIPAFLCRQTDLITAAAATGLPLNVKKGQFVAPQDMLAVVAKARSAGDGGVLLCERGTMFGYHNLVVDMRSLVQLRSSGCPVVFDATHSTQLPGAGDDGSSGGLREFAPVLARAAAAVGVAALFVETHPDPDRAISDAAVQLPLEEARQLVHVVAKLTERLRELT